MTIVDLILQRWRIEKARPYVTPGARVLDIGCADGMLFRTLGASISEGVGIDPALQTSTVVGKTLLISGLFPSALPDSRPFDVITMLAVVEHVPQTDQPKLAEACANALRLGGSLVITVPSPGADRVLGLLKSLRLIDGMKLEQHYGFSPRDTPKTFAVGGLTVVFAERFQFGFNNLFVFQKGSGSTVGAKLAE